MIFPVKVPYTVGPDIVKYEGAAFNAHPDPAYLFEKKKELETNGNHICASINNDCLSSKLKLKKFVILKK
jgi:hypothetical protein